MDAKTLTKAQALALAAEIEATVLELCAALRAGDTERVTALEQKIDKYTATVRAKAAIGG